MRDSQTTDPSRTLPPPARRRGTISSRGTLPERSINPRACRAYVLLETVIATGMLVVGLAVIGAQVQQADTTIRQMDLRLRAMLLADSQLAMLDLGLVKLDSVDPIQEGDFGPRFPDWGWLLITEETAIEGMYSLTLEIWHHRREDTYEPDSFDYDAGERLHAVHAMRAVPQPLDLAADFGLPEDEVEDITERLSGLGIPGLDAASFDPSLLATLDFEQFIEVFPILVDVMGINVDDLQSLVPPDLLEQLKDGGLFGEEDGATGEGTESGGNDNEGGGR